MESKSIKTYKSLTFEKEGSTSYLRKAPKLCHLLIVQRKSIERHYLPNILYGSVLGKCRFGLRYDSRTVICIVL